MGHDGVLGKLHLVVHLTVFCFFFSLGSNIYGNFGAHAPLRALRQKALRWSKIKTNLSCKKEWKRMVFPQAKPYFSTNPPNISWLATSLYVPTYLTTHREKMRCFIGKTRQFCRNIITAMQRNATAKRTHKAFNG